MQAQSYMIATEIKSIQHLLHMRSGWLLQALTTRPYDLLMKRLAPVVVVLLIAALASAIWWL